MLVDEIETFRAVASKRVRRRGVGRDWQNRGTEDGGWTLREFRRWEIGGIGEGGSSEEFNVFFMFCFPRREGQDVPSSVKHWSTEYHSVILAVTEITCTRA